MRLRYPPSALAALALVCLGVLLPAPQGRAHDTQLSSGRARVSGNAVELVLELNARDLDVALGSDLAPAGGPVRAESLARASSRVAEYAMAHTRVFNSAGGSCIGRVGAIEPKAEHVLVSTTWRCPPLAGTLVYQTSLFQEIDPAARHMFTASGDVRRMALLSASTPRVTLASTQVGLREVLVHYFAAGVEHIAIGYDHIAFLLAVILWGRRPLPLIGVVTAFTVAHSVTLTLAVLELAVVPARVVEVLIALSIVYVAAENFFVRDLRRRWLVTFVFGLIHGFGFASVLRDYGLPREALAPALAAFNVGVEAGQLLVVAVALGAGYVLQRVLPASERMRQASPLMLSGCILILGLYWTARRVLDLH
jgi:hydrogenase/urease accessory protein HupE